MAQTLGLIEVFWNGQQIDVEPGGTVKLGGVRNKPVVVGQKVQSARAMMQSEVSITTVILAGQRVSDIFGTGTAELQVNCDTGQQFVWDDAFVADTVDFSGADGGKVKVKFAAGAPLEI